MLPECNALHLSHLSTQLECTAEHLLLLINNAEESYYRFPIDKGNGKKRWIEAPRAPLKLIQQKMLHTILYQLPAHPAAHGFVPNRSIVTNALPHVGKKWVVNFDIRQFFPATKQESIAALLQRYTFLSAEERSALLSLVCKGGALPQGAPTSPHLANIALWDFDTLISAYAMQNQLTYTRYADDLTFSGESIPCELEDIVKSELALYNYRLAPAKSSWKGQHRRQMVTGLVVNEKLNLPRPLRRQIRALLYDIEAHGAEAAFQRSDMSLNQLMGRISLQAMWDKKQATAQLMELASALGIL